MISLSAIIHLTVDSQILIGVALIFFGITVGAGIPLFCVWHTHENYYMTNNP